MLAASAFDCNSVQVLLVKGRQRLSLSATASPASMCRRRSRHHPRRQQERRVFSLSLAFIYDLSSRFPAAVAAEATTARESRPRKYMLHRSRGYYKFCVVKLSFRKRIVGGIAWREIGFDPVLHEGRRRGSEREIYSRSYYCRRRRQTRDQRTCPLIARHDAWAQEREPGLRIELTRHGTLCVPRLVSRIKRHD